MAPSLPIEVVVMAGLAFVTIFFCSRMDAPPDIPTAANSEPLIQVSEPNRRNQSLAPPAARAR